MARRSILIPRPSAARCFANADLLPLSVAQVLGWDVERVKPFILGPVGSQITISFQRVGNQVAGKRSIDVVMIRQPVDP
jgi:hypothetical protein